MSNTFTIKLSDSLLTGTVTMKFEEFPLQGMYKLEPQAAKIYPNFRVRVLLQTRSGRSSGFYCVP